MRVLTLLLLILRSLLLTNGVVFETNMYISSDNWENERPLPYYLPQQRSDMSCVVSCNMEQQDGNTCQSILLNDESKSAVCKSGDIRDCTLILDEKSTTPKTKVALNTDAYEVKPIKAIEVVRYKDTVESYTVNNQCADVLNIPEPVWGQFNYFTVLEEHKGGILACGGYLYELDEHERKCQHWLFGDTEWKDIGAYWNHDHKIGDHVALNNEEVIVISNYVDNAKVEILEGGTWVEKADFPVAMHTNRLIVLSSNEVVSIGGVSNGQPIVEHSLVYRYDRKLDTWTRMLDVPEISGAWPNCALTPDGQLIYCVGAKDSNPRMVRLDLGTWTWFDMGPDGLAGKAVMQSLVFFHLGKIHMYRGRMTLEEEVFLDRMEVFNPDTGSWDETVTLEHSTVGLEFRLLMNLNVICLRN